MKYQSFYRNGWTFSVTSRDCAISQLTFSHGIAHNFGRIKTHEHEKHVHFVQYKYIPYIYPYTIHLITKTRTGKIGMPSNDKQFSRNIATIAGLGDESCICYEHHYMESKYKMQHMGLEESCNYKLGNLTKPGRDAVPTFMPFPRTPKPNYFPFQKNDSKELKNSKKPKKTKEIKERTSRIGIKFL